MEHTPETDLFGDDFNGTVDDMISNLADLSEEELKLLWPARLTEFFEIISHQLKNNGITEPQNTQLSAALVTAVAQHFGGLTFYLPHNKKLKNAIRDIEIYKAFTGNNYAQLAKHHKLSEMTIRTAVANQHRLRFKKIQPSLFEQETPYV